MTNYSIAEAEMGVDAAAIQAVWATNLNGSDMDGAAAKLRLGYTHNLAGPGTVLLLMASGETGPKGTLGLHPRRLHLGSRIVRAVALADFAVDREHRSLGPAMMLMRRGIASGAERFEMIYGFPNHRAAPVFGACKLQRIGDLQRYAKPLRSHPFLSRHLKNWAARVAAPAVDATFRLLDGVRESRLGSTMNCRPVGWDDPVLDQTWAKRSTGVLLSERTARMLAWRFGEPGRPGWQVCAGDDRNGTARGYVVWRNRRGFVEVGDFGSDEPESLTAPLMMAFTRFVRKTGAHTISVEFSGPSGIAAQLQAAGLRRRPEECPVFLGSGFIASFESLPDWFVTAFDSDAD